MCRTEDNLLARIRPALTYANVMATIAVLTALGGGAYAAFKLPKNSVGAQQLKANAVSSAKVKNHSLTGADIRAGTLGQVRSAKSADFAAHAANAAPTGAAGGALTGQYPAPGLTPPEPTRHIADPGEPQFQGTWGNLKGGHVAAGFYRDPFGIVHLQGVITETSGTGPTAFFLPSGYRPGNAVTQAISCASGLLVIDIESDGSVGVGGPTTNTCTLDGVSFRAGEQ